MQQIKNYIEKNSNKREIGSTGTKTKLSQTLRTEAYFRAVEERKRRKNLTPSTEALPGNVIRHAPHREEEDMSVCHVKQRKTIFDNRNEGHDPPELRVRVKHYSHIHMTCRQCL